MLRDMRTRRILLSGFWVVALASVPGCEIENPTAVTVETADPVMLLRGARSKFSDAMGIIGSAFVASDEGLAKTGFQAEDQSGDIHGAPAYTTWYSQVHQARNLAAFAIDRAEALGQTEVGLLARVWHGWTHIRLAELWGAQPFDGGPVVPAAEILDRALADVEAAVTATADSTRHRALAGVARINYIRGREAPANATQLNAAITAAQAVLSQNPRFLWVELPNFNPLNFNFGRAYGPTPFYRDIPLWFTGFPQFAGHDNTLTFNDQTKPQGVVVINADELRMIQAHSHVLLGDLNAAKAAFKAAPLLPINHVRVCRQPRDPPMTQAQIDACVDPMTESQLLTAIDSIQRETQYLSARRPVKEDGAVIMPFELPPTA